MVNHTTPPPKGKGRPPGTPNRTTANAREAITSFVEGNVGRLNRLLDTIEQGVPKDDGEGYLVLPNPDGAFKAIMAVCEYHLPKLNRTDVQALDKNGQPSDGFKITVEHVAVNNAKPD